MKTSIVILLFLTCLFPVFSEVKILPFNQNKLNNDTLEVRWEDANTPDYYKVYYTYDERNYIFLDTTSTKNIFWNVKNKYFKNVSFKVIPSNFTSEYEKINLNSYGNLVGHSNEIFVFEKDDDVIIVDFIKNKQFSFKNENFNYHLWYLDENKIVFNNEENIVIIDTQDLKILFKINTGDNKRKFQYYPVQKKLIVTYRDNTHKLFDLENKLGTNFLSFFDKVEFDIEDEFYYSNRDEIIFAKFRNRNIIYELNLLKQESTELIQVPSKSKDIPYSKKIEHKSKNFQIKIDTLSKEISIYNKNDELAHFSNNNYLFNFINSFGLSETDEYFYFQVDTRTTKNIYIKLSLENGIEYLHYKFDNFGRTSYEDFNVKQKLKPTLLRSILGDGYYFRNEFTDSIRIDGLDEINNSSYRIINNNIIHSDQNNELYLIKSDFSGIFDTKLNYYNRRSNNKYELKDLKYSSKTVEYNEELEISWENTENVLCALYYFDNDAFQWRFIDTTSNNNYIWKVRVPQKDFRIKLEYFDANRPVQVYEGQSNNYINYSVNDSSIFIYSDDNVITDYYKNFEEKNSLSFNIEGIYDSSSLRFVNDSIVSYTNIRNNQKGIKEFINIFNGEKLYSDSTFEHTFATSLINGKYILASYKAGLKPKIFNIFTGKSVFDEHIIDNFSKIYFLSNGLFIFLMNSDGQGSSYRILNENEDINYTFLVDSKINFITEMEDDLVLFTTRNKLYTVDVLKQKIIHTLDIPDGIKLINGAHYIKDVGVIFTDGYILQNNELIENSFNIKGDRHFYYPLLNSHYSWKFVKSPLITDDLIYLEIYDFLQPESIKIGFNSPMFFNSFRFLQYSDNYCYFIDNNKIFRFKIDNIIENSTLISEKIELKQAVTSVVDLNNTSKDIDASIQQNDNFLTMEFSSSEFGFYNIDVFNYNMQLLYSTKEFISGSNNSILIDTSTFGKLLFISVHGNNKKKLFKVAN